MGGARRRKGGGGGVEGAGAPAGTPRPAVRSPSKLARAGRILQAVGSLKTLAHVVICVMCVRYWATRGPAVRAPATPWEETVVSGARGVRSFPWPKSAPPSETVARLVREALPTVMRGTPAEEWPARTKWTPAFLERAIGTMDGVWTSENPYFQYTRPEEDPRGPPGWAGAGDDGLPRGAMGEAAAAQQRADRVSAAEFFRAFLNESGEAEATVYWSDETRKFPALAGGTPGAARHFGVPSESGVKLGEPEVLLWMGGDGATASPHYDMVHNFYVQLKGRKRFVLAPPAAGRRLLHQHPRLHPSARNSQLYLRDDCRNVAADLPFADPAFPALNCLSRRPAFAGPLDARVVTLSPGDVLYLPPFWWHYVSAVGPSVSVSVWTTGAADALAGRAEDVPLPLDTDWPASSYRAAAASYLRMVLAAAGADGLGPVQRVLRSRYARFLAHHRLAAVLVRPDEPDAPGARRPPPRPEIVPHGRVAVGQSGELESAPRGKLGRRQQRLLGENAPEGERAALDRTARALVPACASGASPAEWAASVASMPVFTPGLHARLAARAAEVAGHLAGAPAGDGEGGAFAWSTRDSLLADFLEKAADTTLASDSAAPPGASVPAFLLGMLRTC